MNMKKILIIASLILLFLAWFGFRDNLGHTRSEKTSLYLKICSQKLDDYFHEHSTYPTTEDGLISLLKKGAALDNEDAPVDAWGVKFNYKYPGVHNKDKYDLWSNGADKKPGGEGPNADITNWTNE
ncbi:MAG: type II secretion system protein GspG [bacterium]